MSLCVKYSNEKSHKEKIDSNSGLDKKTMTTIDVLLVKTIEIHRDEYIETFY